MKILSPLTKSPQFSIIGASNHCQTHANTGGPRALAPSYLAGQMQISAPAIPRRASSLARLASKHFRPARLSWRAPGGPEGSDETPTLAGLHCLARPVARTLFARVGVAARERLAMLPIRVQRSNELFITIVWVAVVVVVRRWRETCQTHTSPALASLGRLLI